MANPPKTAARTKYQITRFSARVSRELDKSASKSHFPPDADGLEVDGEYLGFI